jgi:hypothetical protein
MLQDLAQIAEDLGGLGGEIAGAHQGAVVVPRDLARALEGPPAGMGDRMREAVAYRIVHVVGIDRLACHVSPFPP